MNFGELQTEVLSHGFDSASYKTRVQRWLNEAQQRVARSIRFPALYEAATISTQSNTQTVPLPSDFLRLDAVVDVDAQRVLNRIWLDAADATGAATYVGRPVSYAIDEAASAIRLSPVPDGVYALKVRYMQKPTDMSADSDVSIVPSEYHDLLVTYALMRAFRAEDDYEAANFYATMYKDDVRTAANDVQYRSSDPIQVPGHWEY